jgi:hypothetical protein
MLDCIPLDAGAGVPIVGISPANAETDRMHVKATIVRNRFIDVSPLGIKDAKFFTSAGIEQQRKIPCKAETANLISGLRYFDYSRIEGFYFPCGLPRLSRSWIYPTYRQMRGRCLVVRKR